MEEEQKRKEFLNLVNNMTEDEWWNWVREWIPTSIIIEIYENWEIETLDDEIQNIKITKELNKKEAV